MEFDLLTTLTNQTLIIVPAVSGQVLRFDGQRYPTTAGLPIRVQGTGDVIISKGSKWSKWGLWVGNYTGEYFDGSTPNTSTLNSDGSFIMGGGTSGMKFVNNTFQRVGYSAVIGQGKESASVQLKEVGSWLP